MRNRINGNHSRLLERSLQTVFPSATFPFAVRLSIDLMAAGGSETMMALSAASLAMADAGIPIQSQIAGAPKSWCCMMSLYAVCVLPIHVTAVNCQCQADPADLLTQF